MDTAASAGARSDTYQAHYAARFGNLRQPHVRALAWLIDSPDLLDPAAPAWLGQLAAPTVMTPSLLDWLGALDRAPQPLFDALGDKPATRLGLYAEKLMAFFYQAQGRLLAHGLQVRASRNDTVGEFDFLLSDPDNSAGLDHIELATKFYLLAGAPGRGLDGLVGPNLADTLGAKMRKIIDRQLTLGSHPAAQALLSQPVARARALVKGWLFYHHGAAPSPQPAGIAPGHCRGFWCTQAEAPAHLAAHWVVLPRLAWLAPYRLDGGAALLDGDGLAQALAAAFEHNRSPLMVAAMAVDSQDGQGGMVETSRGFIVPDDWPGRALL